MNKIPSFTLKLPELSTRQVWVGAYSEMTGTVIVVFSEKPKKDPVLGDFCQVYNKDIYIASIWVEEWEYWFGTVQSLVDAGILEDRGTMGYVSCSSRINQVEKVIPIDLTTSWHESSLCGLNVHADN